MKIFKKLIPIIIFLTLSFWSIKPLFSNGFFPIHDDTQVARVYELHKALLDGMFPVRWVPDLGYGYGYPLFNFYAPLAYYIGSVFMFLGFNALSATKIMMSLGIVLAGVFMYYFAKEFWGKVGGLISAMLYLYAPYHAVDIFVRGDVAEFWAYTFIPAVFFTIYKTFLCIKKYIDLEKQSGITVIQKQYKKSILHLNIKKTIWLWICLAAFSSAAIILSHNLTAMIITPFLFIFSFILYVLLRKQEKIYKPYFVFLGLLLGITLSAFYWLPVFPELTYTNVLSVVGGGSNYKDHFVCLPQLWDSPWGFAGSAPGCIDGLSFKIGKIHILLSFFSLPTLIVFFKKNKIRFILTAFFVIANVFTIFLMLKQSQFIWDAIPHMAFLQFPWRFLLLVSFFTAFLGGSITYLIPNSQKYLKVGVAVIIVFVILITNAKLFVPQKILNITSESYTNEFNLNWTTSRISDEYMPKNFFRPLLSRSVPSTKIVKNKEINIENLTQKTQSISFRTISIKKSDLHVNLAYFPSWHVYVDQKQSWFKYSNRGLIINIPPGKHNIDILFTQTPVEKVGNALSITGVLVLFAGIIISKKNNQNA